MPAIYLCDKVPDLILCEDLNQWKQYEDQLYQIFKADFIDDWPFLFNLPVRLRRRDPVDGKEEAFYHVTCNHFLESNNDRQPDLERCARICWIRYFIEHIDCTQIPCNECNGILIWDEPWKHNKTRTLIFLEEERYIVVLEKRETCYFLITAYYIGQDHTLAKLKKSYKHCVH